MAAMTEAHKQAMAQGRHQARAVKRYLDALEAGRKPGPKVNTEKLQTRIADTDRAIEDETDPATRVELIQKRLNDQNDLDRLEEHDSVDDLESDFVDVVAEYSDRKGISYAAWREVGVPAKVLRAGGLTRGS